MKKLASTGFIACALLAGMAACDSQKTDSVEQAQETNEQKFEESEMEERKADQSEFLTKAASSGMFEVEAGKLAQKQAQNAEVKNLGQTIASGHEKANSDLKSLASQLNITLPDSMSQEHMDKLKELQEKKKGAEFDKAYVDMIVSAHESDIDMFENASENMQAQEVKSFASNKLPALREHLDQAKQLKEKLNKQ
ncbi:DUF4142 domain-containing protein [Botryobacter ruber]|uniref:DUF4142 domain-containing protein n=1 Tax=Botryobacter ruber TaxID=2171629 RepID=UPI000E0A9C9F|nr:DUF4142 domain-containing protein [Botryobacter ruber]